MDNGKKCLIILMAILIFSCKIDPKKAAAKNMERNAYWQLYRFPEHETSLIFSLTPKKSTNLKFSLHLLPFSTKPPTLSFQSRETGFISPDLNVQIQFDNQPPIKGKAGDPEIAMAMWQALMNEPEMLSISGDFSSLGVSDFIQIPVRQFPRALESALVLTGSKYNVQQYHAGVIDATSTITISDRELYEHLWQWQQDQSVLDSLMYGLKSMRLVSEPMANNEGIEIGAKIIIRVDKTPEGINILPILQISHPALQRQKNNRHQSILPLTCRFGDIILKEVYLPQIDQEGCQFSLEELFPLLLDSDRITLQAKTLTKQNITLWLYTTGLKERLAEAKRAMHLSY